MEMYLPAQRAAAIVAEMERYLPAPTVAAIAAEMDLPAPRAAAIAAQMEMEMEMYFPAPRAAAIAAEMKMDLSYNDKQGINRLLALIIQIFYPDLKFNLCDLRQLLPERIKLVPTQPTHKITMPVLRIVRIVNQLTIYYDNEIGMTKSDLAKILMIIRQSGPEEFKEATATGADISMIGQFGDESYTAYLVAEQVVASTELITDCQQYVWSYAAGGTFTVTRDEGATKLTLFRRWGSVSNLAYNKCYEFLSFKDYITRFVRHNKSYTYGDVLRNHELSNYLERKDYKVHRQEFLFSATKKVPELDEEKKEAQKNFEGLCNVIKEALGNKVEKVVVSDRVVHSPCCLVTGEYGWTLNLERIMMVRAFEYSKPVLDASTKKKMVINPKNPIMKELKKMVDCEQHSKNVVNNLVLLLFRTSLVTSGFSLDEPYHFRYMIYKIVKVVCDKLCADMCPEENAEGSETKSQARNTKKQKTTEERFLWLESLADYAVELNQLKISERELILRLSCIVDVGTRDDLLSLLEGTVLVSLDLIMEDTNAYGNLFHRILMLLLEIKDGVPDSDMPLVWPLKLFYYV